VLKEWLCTNMQYQKYSPAVCLPIWMDSPVFISQKISYVFNDITVIPWK